MNKLKLIVTVLFVFIVTHVALAQSDQVTGYVKDAGTGEAIPYASVMVKGTGVAVLASADGFYKISVPKKSSILTFSSVGYKMQDVKISNRTTIDVNLNPDTVIEDLVVVAYGQKKKEAVTGAVSSVAGKGLVDAPVASVENVLSGKLAGVSISSSTGQPGSFTNIRIRGNSSITASNEPLWVIDGIPVMNKEVSEYTNTMSSMPSLNPSDIASITVLKDAAAAAAYGSRAANGVILVTTKSGSVGKASLTFRAKVGVNMLKSDSDYKIMNSRQLLSYFRQATENANIGLSTKRYDPDSKELIGIPGKRNPFYFPESLAKTNTDWGKVYTRLGKFQEYEFAVSGGNSRGKYYATAGYQKNEGIVYGVEFSKIYGRVNSSYKVLDNLEIGTRINLSYKKSRDIPMGGLYFANPIFASQVIVPWVEPKTKDGKWNLNIPLFGTNSRAVAEYDRRSDEDYTLNSIGYIRWTPIKNLTIESKNAIESHFVYGDMYWSPYSTLDQEPTVFESFTRYGRLTTSNTATYSASIKGHTASAVLGFEAYQESYNTSNVKGGKVNPDIPYLNTSTPLEVDKNITNQTMVSFFGIFDYNYKERYFAQANIRRDGSSLFGANRMWGTFWSGSFSWNITNEPFWKYNPISLLKLRLSYGVNGNNSLAVYRAYGTYVPSMYNGISGLRPNRPDNPNLGWEKSATLNFGLDFGVLNNRITGSVDVYRKLTTDLLLNKGVASSTGWTRVLQNVGSVENRGVELQLSATVLAISDFVWNLDANMAINRTKILSLGDGIKELDYVRNQRSYTSIKHYVGSSMYTYNMRHYYGVNPTNGEALWWTTIDTPNGKEKALTNDINKADLIKAGSPEPKFMGGFGTNLSWRGLNLSVNFEYKYGNKVWLGSEMGFYNNDGKRMDMNQMVSALNYWKKPGDVGVNPIPIAGNKTNSSASNSTRAIFDGSYLRLKDITLSYNLPAKWLKYVKMKNLKVYVSGLNLYCFNDVPYFDPERGVDGFQDGQYPLTKAIVGGLELSF